MNSRLLRELAVLTLFALAASRARALTITDTTQSITLGYELHMTGDAVSGANYLWTIAPPAPGVIAIAASFTTHQVVHTRYADDPYHTSPVVFYPMIRSTVSMDFNNANTRLNDIFFEQAFVATNPPVTLQPKEHFDFNPTLDFSSTRTYTMPAIQPFVADLPTLVYFRNLIDSFNYDVYATTTMSVTYQYAAVPDSGSPVGMLALVCGVLLMGRRIYLRR